MDKFCFIGEKLESFIWFATQASVCSLAEMLVQTGRFSLTQFSDIFYWPLSLDPLASYHYSSHQLMSMQTQTVHICRVT